MGPHLYSSFSIRPYSSTNTSRPLPPIGLTKRLLSHAQVKKRPSFPLFDKSRLKPRWGLPAEMPGTRQGCPLSSVYSPPPFASWVIHPLLMLSFLVLILPSCAGHSLSLPPNLFIVVNSQHCIKTSSDSSERKQPDLAERDIRHGCQWPFCMPFVHLGVVEIDK